MYIELKFVFKYSNLQGTLDIILLTDYVYSFHDFKKFSGPTSLNIMSDLRGLVCHLVEPPKCYTLQGGPVEPPKCYTLQGGTIEPPKCYTLQGGTVEQCETPFKIITLVNFNFSPCS